MISNEILLFLHASTIVGLVFFAFRYGKETLISFIALCGILANLLILKQIDLFSLHVTCTDVFMIGQLLGLNLLQEIYGAETARKAISISFFTSLCTVLLGYFHLAYTPNTFDATHSFYTLLFSPLPRIMIASIGTDFMAAHLERFVYGRLSHLFQKRFFGLRNILTMVISQSFDTVVFSYLGLYGIIASVPHIIATSLVIKLILIICMSLLSATAYATFSKK